MVYAYDLWAQMPVKDLYDTLIMALAINAAKDMYDKGEQAIKDFRKEYGDFQTQLPEDMKWYQQNFDSAPFILNLYDRGIDPLRSVEGRAAIQRWLNSRPYATLNKAKSNAEAYDNYLKNKAILDSKGLYDPDLEAFVFGVDPNKFSSANGDTWTRLSPVLGISLHDLTKGLFEKMTPRELTAEEAKNILKDSFNPNKNYTGILYSDLLKTAGTGVPGLMGDPRMAYFRQKAADKLDPNATQQEIDLQFQKDVADANLRSLINPIGAYDDFAKAKYSADLQDRNDANRQRRTYFYKKLEAIDKAIKDRLTGWTGRRRAAYEQLMATLDLNKIPKTYKSYKSVYQYMQNRLIGDDAYAGWALVANNTQQSTIFPGSNKQGYETSFGGYADNLQLTECRIQDFAEANMPIRKSKAIVAFNDWLRSNQISGHITKDYSPTALYNKPINSYDVSATMVVPMSAIDKFFDGKKDTYKTDLLNLIGAKSYTGLGRSKGNGSTLNWSNVEYVALPVTRTYDPYGLADNLIDATAANITNRGSKITNEYEQKDELK